MGEVEQLVEKAKKVALNCLITKRNKSNSKFEIIVINGDLKFPRGKMKEASIIFAIEKGYLFYTAKKAIKDIEELTDVIVVNGHIKSVPNGTTTDNIGELPIFEE